VELTRKRQGQNIYELFGKRCSTCDGTGLTENILNREISNLKIKDIEDKSNKSNNTKTLDIETSLSTDKQEKIFDKELINTKDLSKENSSNKKENENDNLNQLNSKEKNIITVDLTNEEKIVFSQLGINPLIKLGKEYLTSNNFVRLKDNSEKTEKTLNNKKTKAKQIKKISKSEEEIIQIHIESNANPEDKSTNQTDENNEVVFVDKKDEIELTDELNNSRKKRRRSSASIE
jgi:ribonuclease E